MANPEQMKTPKSYWQIRRTEGHRDWTFGNWRELFQNAVDAGSKRVDITVAVASGKGSFGRDPTMDRVLRVTFQDDGKGMDERTIRDVFLKPGESTKRNADTVGGFGTARIMLCFSHVRYALQTHQWVVEGDGSEFTVESLPEAIESKRAEILAAETNGRQEVVASMRAELAAMQASPADLRGCRLEIDIDPAELAPGWSNRPLTVEALLSRLDDYLNMSQVPCKVFVNGEEKTQKTLRGPARRQLVATDSDGTETAFAKVHLSQSDRAKYKNKVIVRVDGATMFTNYTSADAQVILEIDKSVARKVLTDNRDSLKSPYSDVLESFLEELSVDTSSALKEKDKRKHIEFKGGKGKLRAILPNAKDIADGRIPVDFSRRDPEAKEPPQETRMPMARYTTREEYETHGFGGVPAAVVDQFIEAVGNGQDTCLADVAGWRDAHPDEIIDFRNAIQNGEGPEALAILSSDLREGLAAELARRLAAAQRAETAKFADINDIHIQVDDLGVDDVAEKQKNALRRHSPSYWRKKGEHLEGRGMQAHMTLAVWQASVEEALRAALSLRPSLAKDGGIEWAVGWYFGRSQERYTGSGYEKSRTAAQHQEREGAHLFLLNPVLEDGQSAYDISKEVRQDGKDPIGGLQDIDAIAQHEVAHLLGDRHDEGYSSFLTNITSLFRKAKAREAARGYVDALRVTYGRGKSRIQAMDSSADIVVMEAEIDGATPTKAASKARKLRPAERLLAHAAPAAAAIIGAAMAPENISLAAADKVREVFCGAVAPDEDGTIVVDCDVLNQLNLNVVAAVAVAPEEHVPDSVKVEAVSVWDAPINLDFGSEEPPALFDAREVFSPTGIEPVTAEITDLANVQEPSAAKRIEFRDVDLDISRNSSRRRDVDLAPLEPPAAEAKAPENFHDPLAALVGYDFDLGDLGLDEDLAPGKAP